MRPLLIAPMFAGLLILAACSSPWRPTSTEVNLDLEPRLEGRTVVIAGTTDLPDGVYLLWDVTLLRGEPRPFDQGEMQVRDRRFEERVDVSSWPEGEIEVWVGFELYGDSDYQQPREVVDWFGSDGENLTGPNVEDRGEFRRVTDLVQLELP